MCKKKPKKMVHVTLKVFVKGELEKTLESDFEARMLPWIICAEDDIMRKIVTFEYTFKEI